MRQLVGLLIGCLLMCVYTQVAIAEEIERDSKCVMSDVGCVKSQFGVDFTDDNYGIWSPKKGGVFFYGRHSGHDIDSFDKDTFIIYLYFDREAINFYYDRPWAALEIDVIFANTYNWWLSRIDSASIGGPEGTIPLRDTILELPNKMPATRGITVINPSAMKVGWNMFIFSLKDNLLGTGNDPIRIEADFQLVANIADWSFVKTLYQNNNFAWATRQMAIWGSVFDAGFYGSLAYEHKVGGDTSSEVFKYFMMDGAKQVTWNGIEGEKMLITQYSPGKGFYWTDRNKSGVATKISIEDFLGNIIEPSDFVHTSVREYAEDMLEKISKSDLVRYIRGLINFVKEGINNAGGNDYGNGNNPNNQETPPDQEVIKSGSPRRNGSPDMSILTMSVSKGGHSTRHHEIEQDPEETFYAYSKITNYGARAKDFKIKFYIDGGKKNFDRDDDDYQSSIRIDDFYSGAEIRYSKKLTVPEEPGEYYVYSCITSIDEDKNQSNNCSDEDDKDTYAKLIVEEPILDVDIQPTQFNLTDGKTSLSENESYGFEVQLTNNGTDTPLNYTRTSYHIKGSGTNDQWLYLGDDGTKAENLSSGSLHWESIDNLNAPFGEGLYTARACADYQNAETETDESNNCIEFDFYVAPSSEPQPTITVTNPDSSDEWRSDEKKHIEWTSTNLSLEDRVKVEYSLDGGESWMLVDDTAVNDGGKYWDMCNSKTEDSDDAFIKITLIANLSIYDLSDEFTIDHAKECE